MGESKLISWRTSPRAAPRRPAPGGSASLALTRMSDARAADLRAATRDRRREPGARPARSVANAVAFQLSTSASPSGQRERDDPLEAGADADDPVDVGRAAARAARPRSRSCCGGRSASGMQPMNGSKAPGRWSGRDGPEEHHVVRRPPERDRAAEDAVEAGADVGRARRARRCRRRSPCRPGTRAGSRPRPCAGTATHGPDDGDALRDPVALVGGAGAGRERRRARAPRASAAASASAQRGSHEPPEPEGREHRAEQDQDERRDRDARP